MPTAPDVLLIDDGELDDVQKLLDSMSVSYGRVRGAAVAARTPTPRKLLVTTPRRIDAVPMGSTNHDAIVRIVVVSEDSPTLRAQLRDVGFDYLVRRPVHPEALRLMLMRCLFSGAERRGEERVPVGFEVSYRTGLLARRAVLADISTRGCRILSKWAAEPGKHISLTIPQRAGVSEPLTLRGTVVRMRLDEHLGPEGPYSAAVEFDELPDAVRRELEWVLEERARGPARLGEAGVEPKRPARQQPAADLDAPETRAADLTRDVDVEIDVRVVPEAAPAPASETIRVVETDRGGPADADDAHEERREGPRASYARRVPAFGDRAMRVLVARDIAMGGMRVEHDSGLELGDRLHLAIYGSADEEPFLVWATVERSDADRGLILAFDALPDPVANRLEQVVVNLPAVESLHDDEAHAMGTVVTEILSA